MKTKTIMSCAFAGSILATTMSMAHSAELPVPTGTPHARHHAVERTASLHRHRAVRHARVRLHGDRVIADRAPSHSLLDHDRPSTSGGQSGIASVYSGGRTANGEIASAGRLTAAHRSLPFGTMVRVTHRGTGRSVVVRINDRGPFVRGRLIDLTPAAAHALGFSGLAPVTLSVVHG
jgi:rare lipoprotein A